MHTRKLGRIPRQRNLLQPKKLSKLLPNSYRGSTQPSTMLYQDLDQKQKRNDDKMLATTKRLKLVSNGSAPSAWHCSGNNQHNTPMDTPNDSPPANHLQPPHNIVFPALNGTSTHTQGMLSMLWMGSCPCPMAMEDGSVRPSSVRGPHVD